MSKNTLPKEIIALPNIDKQFHEKWNQKRDMLNIAHPFRGVFLGPPNCGKGTVVTNILLRAKPEFEEIFVIHCDPEYTKEWESIGATMLDDIPAPEEWEGKVKTLVILDDLEYKGMNKQTRRNLDRLWGFCSTHKHISCCLLAQDAFNVPPIIRRCSNLWVLWKINDLDSMSACARKTGMKVDEFRYIFDNFIKDTHDSLWIDQTHKTPYPLRINGYNLLSYE